MASSSQLSEASESACFMDQRDSGGFQWEHISMTDTPEDRDNLLPPSIATDQPKKLCGYLHKLTTNKLIKTYRSRWFLFDDQKCCLYYFNSNTDFTPQGVIDISKATFTYNVENLPKCQFEINTPERVYSFQASTQHIMFFWLGALQKKRRTFSTRRKHSISAATTAERGLMRESLETAVIKEEEELGEAPSGLLLPNIPSTTSPDSDHRRTLLQRVASFSSKLRSGNAATPPTSGSASFLSTPPSSDSSASPTTLRRSNFYVDPPIPEENSKRESPAPEEGDVDFIAESSAAAASGGGRTASSRDRTSSKRNITDMLRKMAQRGSTLYTPEDTACPHCRKLEESLTRLQAELSHKEREVQDRDEINDFLRAEIRLADMKTKVQDELMTVSPHRDSTVDVIVQREQTITQFQRLLEEAITEKDRVTTEFEAKRREVRALGEQVELFRETMKAKDDVVVQLTNKLFQAENKGQQLTNPLDAMLPTASQSVEEELERMTEAVEAYKHQNKFLSSEILELNALRADDEEAFRNLTSRYHQVEAEYYRTESKFMVLLHETQNPMMVTQAVDTEVVSQLLEEAQIEEQGKMKRTGSYDEYGFSKTAVEGDMVSEAPLKHMAKQMNQHALKAQREYDAAQASLTVRWDNYMASSGNLKDFVKTVELKRLIRDGVPSQHRSNVWKWCIRLRLGKNYTPGTYQAILQEHVGKSSVAVNQIELDLLRTLPTNKYYDKPDAQGVAKLRRVLVAFSWYHPDVGYCQGLNRLAAIALLFLDEEDAFWCLAAIVQHTLPQDYFDKSLLGSQTDQRVLRELLNEKLPKLSQHLSLCEIDFSLITFNWFHTIYVDNLPVETMLRIWDTFLYEGSKVLFRFAIAIFKYYEEQLLVMNNSIKIFNCLRSMCQDASDVDRLVQIGFSDINPFPMSRVVKLRCAHREKIKWEQAQLDAMRNRSQPRSVQSSREIDSDDEP